MGCPPDIGRRAAVMRLLDTGMTPRQVGVMLGVSANAVYNIRRKVTGAPVRRLRASNEVQAGPACRRCGLHGPHECLTAGSIYWQPRADR